MRQRFINNFSTLVAATFGLSDMSLRLLSTTGLPILGVGEYFYLTVYRQTGIEESGHEVIKVTDVVGDMLIVSQRSVEGAAASQFLAGDRVQARVTAMSLQDKADQLDMTAAQADILTNAAAIRATNSAIAEVITVHPLTITTVGPVTIEPIIVRCYPTPLQVAGVVGDHSGKWASVTMFINNGLTKIVFDDLQGTTGTFSPSSMPDLLEMRFPALKYATGGFTPNGFSGMTLFEAPVLEVVVGAFGLANAPLVTTLNFTGLKFLSGSFNVNTLAALMTLSIPALHTVVQNFSPNTMASLVTISAPALKVVGGVIGISNMGALATCTFNAIEYIGSVSITTGCTALTTFMIGSTIKQVNGNVVISSAALSQASVDDILVKLAALNGTGGTTTYSGKTVTLTGTSATPSATGLAAKATLVARGCSVMHN